MSARVLTYRNQTVRIIIAHSHLRTLGGGERVTLELLRRLSLRHEVELWASRYEAERTYAELSAFPRRDLLPYGWALAHPRAGAVVSQTLGSNLLALRHPGVICYLHSLRSPYLRGARPASVVRRLLERAALRRAAAVLTNSEYAANRVWTTYRRPTEVVAPGVDDTFFMLPEVAGTYALVVSRLAPEKGVERLLEWCRDVPIELVVVGDGPPAYAGRLRSMAGPWTRFAGPLTGPALAAAYAGCRFLAFLPYEEEFGMAALEAMAAGKPVLASAEGGLPSLVGDGRTGFLVATREDFVARASLVAGDDDLCRSLGQAGREVARTYSWERFARRIEELCLAQLERHTG